jgi:hypothetical protein
MMRKLYWFSLVVVLAVGCKSESDVGPAQEKTFIRYLGSENNNVAVLAEEAGDGFTLLSYSEIAGDVVGDVSYQIKLIHLDAFGNWMWEKNYPEGDDKSQLQMRASSFISLKDASGALTGYLIIGDWINANGTTKLQLVYTDANGENAVYNTISDASATVSLQGRAVVQDNTGDFVVLAKVNGDPSNDMFVAKIAAADVKTINNPLKLTWFKKYGAGVSTLINRLYGSTSTGYSWGGSVRNPISLKNDIRLIRVPENSDASFIGGPIGDSDDAVDENAVDFCPSVGGWTVTGSTTKNEVNGDIYIMKLTTNTQTVFKQILPEFEANQKEEGVSITETTDGSYAVLANVGTTTKQQDLLVLKCNASGGVTWSHNYGSSDKQEGASIRTTSDGSYLVFATTYFGNVKKLMLMKLNKNGEL